MSRKGETVNKNSDGQLEAMGRLRDLMYYFKASDILILALL